MVKVRNSADATAGGKGDERLHKALLISSVGKIPFDLATSLSPTPTMGLSPKSKFSKSDGDFAKYTYSKGNKLYREEISNLEDCKNTRFKLEQYRQEKVARRLERKGKNKSDEKNESRRRRRKSNGSSGRRRKKVDAERLRNKTENSSHSTEGDDSGPQDSLRNSTTTKIKHNTLSSYFSTPQLGARQGRRSCRSIDTSSTTKTKKQSNKGVKKSLSVNDLLNSPWSNGGKVVRRIPRNSRLRDKMDNHYPLSPAIDRPVRKHFTRRRSKSEDISHLTRSDSGTRNKPRRKYRNSMSGSIEPIPNTSLLLLTPKQPDAATEKQEKPTTKKTFITEPGLVTPYSVPRETECKSSTRSYSDRVMIAAESNKTPMASLKKHLRDEKVYSSSENETANRVSGQTGSKKVPQTLLQIPFSEGTSTGMSEKRDVEADNKKTTKPVQGFRRSVVRSMKRQAKNTKRKIGRQISKMIVSNVPIDERTRSNQYNGIQNIPVSPIVALKPPSGLFGDGENGGIQNSPMSPLTAVKPPSGIHISPRSPLTAVKPPSGLCPHEDLRGNQSSPSSPLVALKPPSGHVPRKKPGSQGLNFPGGHRRRRRSGSRKPSENVVQDTSPYLPSQLPESEIDQKHGRKSRKKTRSSGSRRRRPKKKSNSKEKLIDGHLEFSVEHSSYYQVITSGNLGPSLSEQGSSSRSFDFELSGDMTFDPNQSPIFDEADEAAEDSTLERSYKINPDIHSNGKFSEETYALILDGDSTIEDDGKMSPPRHARGTSIADNFASPSTVSTEVEISKSSLLSTSEDIHTVSDRNNRSSISTLITAPSSPSCTQSKSNIEKSSCSLNQCDNSELGPKCTIIDEEDRSQQQNPNNFEGITVPKIEETEEKETNTITSTPALSLHDIQASTEETNPNSLASLNKNVSKIHDEPQQQRVVENKIIESQALECQEIREQQTTKEPDLSSELLVLVKNNGKSKKESRANDRKETTRKLFEKHKKETERLRRNHQQLMEMDITVEHDPLAVSEISNPYHVIEQKRSQKSRRTSKAESTNTSKEKKPKTRRRVSNIRSCKKHDDSKSGLLVSPVGAIEENYDTASSIVNKSNSQILNLRMMLLQSNPAMLLQSNLAMEPIEIGEGTNTTPT